jgi:hypothetical protein
MRLSVILLILRFFHPPDILLTFLAYLSDRRIKDSRYEIFQKISISIQVQVLCNTIHDMLGMNVLAIQKEPNTRVCHIQGEIFLLFRYNHQLLLFTEQNI